MTRTVMTSTEIGLSLSVDVRYIPCTGFPATVERGSGVHTQAAEPESVEIISVIATRKSKIAGGKDYKLDITGIVPEDVLDKIASEILDQDRD